MEYQKKIIPIDGLIKKYYADTNGDIWNEERILLSGKNKRGYKQRTLCFENKKYKTYLQHYLITLTFIGERKKGYEINHIDHNKENNNIDNLEYILPYENTLHGNQTKYKNTNGIPDEILLDIFDLKYNDFEDKYNLGISHQHYSRIKNGQRRPDLFKLKYNKKPDKYIQTVFLLHGEERYQHSKKIYQSKNRQEFIDVNNIQINAPTYSQIKNVKQRKDDYERYKKEMGIN